MSCKPSNGTMGHMWMDRWCFRCVHDHVASHRGDGEPDYENGCELLCLLLAGMGDDMPEFISHEEMNDRGWTPDSYECRVYERCPCQDEGGWEPPVKPTPDPNQGLLFEVIDETPFTPMVVIPASHDTEVDVRV